MRSRVIGALLLMLLGVCCALAQEARVISGGEVTAYFARSEKAVGKLPLRTRTTVEIGETRYGEWKPYSSWVSEVIRPDRSRLTYASGRSGDFIHIGKVSWTLSEEGIWTETALDGFRPDMVSPSSFRGFSESPLRSFTEMDNGGNLVVTMQVRKKADALESDIGSGTALYYFDSQGVLFRQMSFSHNSFKWLRRTENYQYDPDMRIEAPVVRP
jgi:hypothetical protein